MRLSGKIRNLERKLDGKTDNLIPPPLPSPIVQQVSPDQSRSLLMVELEQFFKKAQKDKR